MDLDNINGGFFKAYSEKIRSSVNVEKFKNFCNLSTDEARFDFIHNLESIDEELKLVEVNKENNSTGKCIQSANEFKKLGNAEFQASKWNAALNYYNSCYRLIPSNCTSELSIILANRSAALYHLECYEHALKDIEESIKFGYPKDIMYKVVERRARCFLAQKKHNEALAAFKDALYAIDDGKLTPEKRAKLERDAQVMIKLLSRGAEMEQQNKQKTKGTKKVENESKDKNDVNHVDILNKSIKIDSNETEGRFAKAEGNIRVGDILVLEKPHASVLLTTYSKSNCANCFRRPLAPIFCRSCINVMFCSEKCKRESNTHHETECSILPTIWGSGTSITCHLALRIISQKSPQYFIEVKDSLKNLTPEITDKLPNDDYRKVYTLVCHEHDRGFEDFFQRSVMAYFLTKCLEWGEYFVTNPDRKTFDFIGSLVLRNLQFLQFNAHEVAELQQENLKDVGKSMFIGGAIYPTLSLFNHSCDPGIVRYYNGNTVVARAVKTIRKGEVVAENYGPIFTQKIREDRKTHLKGQYWFNCECQACNENWPLFKNMENTKMRFRCEGSAKHNCKNVLLVPVDTNEFMFKCTECGEHTNILKGLKAIQDTDMMFRTANRLLESGEAGKALSKYIEMLNILDENLAPPFRDFHLCQQGIRRCMLECGNRHISGKK